MLYQPSKNDERDMHGDKTMATNAENGGGRRGGRDTMKKLKMHALLSVITFAIGVVLVIIVGFVEDDPMIPPFLLIVFGIGWYIITRVRIRSLHK